VPHGAVAGYPLRSETCSLARQRVMCTFKSPGVHTLASRRQMQGYCSTAAQPRNKAIWTHPNLRVGARLAPSCGDDLQRHFVDGRLSSGRAIGPHAA